jgi:hypothetical protein
MPATVLDPVNLQVGAGWLWTAPVGTAKPADLSTAWATVDTDWFQVGFTQDGHVFNIEMTVEGLMVAEIKDPIRAEYTERKAVVEFAAAEMTVPTLNMAFNGPTATTFTGGTKITPPNINLSPTERMLGWESFDGTERYVWPRVVQTGAIGISRKKPPEYATVPMAFLLLNDGDETTALFDHLLATSRG